MLPNLYDAAGFQLVQNLRDAQSTAVFTRRYVKVSFYPSANYYTVERTAGGSEVRHDFNGAVGFAGSFESSPTNGDSVMLTASIQAPPQTSVDLYFSPSGAASTSGTSEALIGAAGSEGRISLMSRSGVVIDVFVSPIIGRVRMAWR